MYRQRKRQSQMYLAEVIDKSATYISYLENGVKCPSLETLVDLANALEVTADALLGESIRNTGLDLDEGFCAVLADCSDTEKRFLTESSRKLKEILRSTVEVHRWK